MADIDREQIQRIAELAHLSLSDDEAARMTDELGAIVDYVKQLQEVDIEGVPPTQHVMIERTPLRADGVQPSLARERVLAEAPEAEADGSFVVAAFVDEG